MRLGFWGTRHHIPRPKLDASRVVIVASQCVTSRARAPQKSFAQMSRQRALSLYRQIRRAGDQLPTVNQREWVKAKTISEFRTNSVLTDEEDIQLHLRVAEAHLDSINVQVQHLRTVFSTDWANEFKKPYEKDPMEDQVVEKTL